MTLALQRYSDTACAAQALASAVATELEAALAHRPRALLLVSGGRSPLLFFEALRVQSIAWERIDVSLVDERSVTVDDEAANARLVRTHLLCDAAAAARWIGLLPEEGEPMEPAKGDLEPLQRAQEAADRANQNTLLASAAVVVLGVGADGHTASLFVDAPQWPLAQVTPQRYLALQPGAAPHARISLSLRALRQQGRCHVWATGAEKARVLARLEQSVQERGGGPAPWPTSVPPPAWLADAGPMACLIADPELLLIGYCCADDASQRFNPA